MMERDGRTSAAAVTSPVTSSQACSVRSSNDSGSTPVFAA